jgi:molybdopterin synthase sulfur carrier subunit
MKVRVVFFASLKEHLGKSGMQLELTTSPSVEALWKSLSSGKDALPAQILFAVNHQYVKADYQIKDGDEVAFFPPVTGG